MLSDRDRWDQRWARRDDPVGPPAQLLTTLSEQLPRSGMALDVASGRGRQARWLAARGMTVTAVDVSPLGLASQTTGVRRVVRDLRTEALPVGPWDLICCVDFYLPSIFPSLQSSLAPGGWLVFSQPDLQNLERHGHPSARFLVDQDAVSALAAGLRIVRCDAAWRKSGRHEAWLVARRD